MDPLQLPLQKEVSVLSYNLQYNKLQRDSKLSLLSFESGIFELQHARKFVAWQDRPVLAQPLIMQPDFGIHIL